MRVEMSLRLFHSENDMSDIMRRNLMIEAQLQQREIQNVE